MPSRRRSADRRRGGLAVVAVDEGAKLGDISTRERAALLVVSTDARAVTHHRRGEAGDIATRVLRDGWELDLPGLRIAVADLFASLD